MKTAELRVKIKSLAAECTIIRLDEGRLKKRARRARARQVDAAVGRLVASFWSLRHHRAGVRAEVRASLLALAFLRRRPYAAVEEVAREEPPFGRASQIAARFGGDRFTESDWDAWVEVGSRHWSAGQKVLKARENAKRVKAEAAPVAVRGTG